MTGTVQSGSPSRVVHVYVNDAHGQPLVGARVAFSVDGQRAGEVTHSRGGARFEIPDRSRTVAVSASYAGETQEVTLAADSDAHTFVFRVSTPHHDGKQRVAIALGAALLLLGIGSALVVTCPRPAQAFAIVVALALGAAVMMFGFLRSFALSVTLSGATGAGAGAVFLLIYLWQPTILTTLACTEYAVPLRVVDADQPTQPVAKAVVVLRGQSTERVEMNANGEGKYSFAESQLGRDIQVWAAAEGWHESAPQTLTLARLNGVVEIPLARNPGPPEPPVPLRGEGPVKALQIRAGAFVDAIQLLFDQDGNESPSAILGAGGGSWSRQACREGHVAVGLHGASGKYLDRLGLVCADARTLKQHTHLAAIGGSGGQDFEDICETGQVLIGLEGSRAQATTVAPKGTTQVVAQVKSLCAPHVAPPQAPIHDLSGMWEDKQGVPLQLSQRGHVVDILQTNMLGQIIARGTGELHGRQITIVIQHIEDGLSKGRGTVSEDGSRITGTLTYPGGSERVVIKRRSR